MKTTHFLAQWFNRHASSLLIAAVAVIAVTSLIQFEVAKRESIQTQALVVDVFSERTKKHVSARTFVRTYAGIVIEFEDKEGNPVTTKVKTGSPVPYAIGDQVQIFYPPKHPTRVEIDSFVTKWRLVIFIGIILLISFFFHSFWKIFDKRPGKKDSDTLHP